MAPALSQPETLPCSRCAPVRFRVAILTLMPSTGDPSSLNGLRVILAEHSQLDSAVGFAQKCASDATTAILVLSFPMPIQVVSSVRNELYFLLVVPDSHAYGPFQDVQIR